MFTILYSHVISSSLHWLLNYSALSADWWVLVFRPEYSVRSHSSHSPGLTIEVLVRLDWGAEMRNLLFCSRGSLCVMCNTVSSVWLCSVSHRTLGERPEFKISLPSVRFARDIVFLSFWECFTSYRVSYVILLMFYIILRVVISYGECFTSYCFMSEWECFI